MEVHIDIGISVNNRIYIYFDIDGEVDVDAIIFDATADMALVAINVNVDSFTSVRLRTGNGVVSLRAFQILVLPLIIWESKVGKDHCKAPSS